MSLQRPPSPDFSERTGLERFGLLASAIAGRSLEIAATDGSGPAWTDGTTVFVDDGATESGQRASVAVQAALVGAGSLDPAILRVLGRRPDLARRYLAVEGHRALGAQKQLVPPALGRLIDTSIAGRTGSPSESLVIAQSREQLENPPDVFGVIRPKKLATVGEERERDGLGQHVPRNAGRQEVEELGSEEEETDAVVDLFSSPVGGGGGIGRWLKRLLSEGRSSEAGPPGADAATRWSRRGSRAARTASFSTSPAPIPEALEPAERTGVVYPEWDYSKGRYKPEWCRVTEIEAASRDLAPFVPPAPHPFRRPLARLGLDLENRRRQPQGDDIDIDAVVDACVQLRSESAPDEDVYVEALRRRRDLAVLLLLDVSGSAGEASSTGGSVLEHQKGAAAALMVALHEMGDRVALYGFRSQGRSSVQLTPVKRFGEDLDGLVMMRLGGLQSGAYTRLGAAIRHGTAVLEREAGTSRRLLVVLSDGFAYDHGYERAYGEADSRRALAEARRLGIGTLCLSIGAKTGSHELRRVFGVAAHAAVARTDDLHRMVGPLFRSALRSADLQRKRSQRRSRTRERLAIERKTG